MIRGGFREAAIGQQCIRQNLFDSPVYATLLNVRTALQVLKNCRRAFSEKQTRLLESSMIVIILVV